VTAGEPLTALCIDDDPGSRKLVHTILTHGGLFEVLTANDGESGIGMATDRMPDIILLDLDLPDLHGSMVAKRLRADERTRSIPVIAISATSNPRPSWITRAGLEGFVRKPILDIPAFIDLVQATAPDR
jgi:CheY-like chemotaxis protein